MHVFCWSDGHATYPHLHNQYCHCNSSKNPKIRFDSLLTSIFCIATTLRLRCNAVFCPIRGRVQTAAVELRKRWKIDEIQILAKENL